MATLHNRPTTGVIWSLEPSDFAVRSPIVSWLQPGTAAAVADAFETIHSPNPECTTVDLEIAPAGVASSSITACAVRTIGFVFDQLTDPRQDARGKVQGAASREQCKHSPSDLLPASGQTRIRPPRDIVKLEDRLRLLLQPPLESLLAAQALRFAFPPFGYQLDGVAFLYPRHEAVLADEMGLGKTMQAVTAVRLLVHHGQLRRVLLVCPKPLVTNWQREFAMWAPELPVTAVEGGAARRQWLWREASDLVTIANYEALVRDRSDVCSAENYYDLVVLDEAQRIKNAGSATNEVVRSIPRGRSWALTGTPIENSVEDLVGIFEFVSPGQLNADDETASCWPRGSDHVLAPHEGPGAHRLAAQVVSRCRSGAHARAGRGVSTGRGRGRGAATANEARADDPARV